MSSVFDRWHAEWKDWGYRFTRKSNSNWRVEGDDHRWQVLYRSAATSDERFENAMAAMEHAEKLAQAREDIKVLRLDKIGR